MIENLITKLDKKYGNRARSKSVTKMKHKYGNRARSKSVTKMKHLAYGRKLLLSHRNDSTMSINLQMWHYI